MRRLDERPIVCLISSGRLTDENFDKNHKEELRIFASASRTGISIIQIREKKLSAKNLSLLTRSAVSLARETNTRILVNERFDVALACGADGVHLPANAMTVEVVRRLVPATFLIGVSTHSEEALKDAFDGGADFAVFGPVFDTPGKPNTVGIKKLNAVCRKFAEFPILALGGINESNVGMVLASEAAGFAAIRFLNNAGVLGSINIRITR